MTNYFNLKLKLARILVRKYVFIEYNFYKMIVKMYKM